MGPRGARLLAAVLILGLCAPAGAEKPCKCMPLRDPQALRGQGASGPASPGNPPGPCTPRGSGGPSPSAPVPAPPTGVRHQERRGDELLRGAAPRQPVCGHPHALCYPGGHSGGPKGFPTGRGPKTRAGGRLSRGLSARWGPTRAPQRPAVITLAPPWAPRPPLPRTVFSLIVFPITQLQQSPVRDGGDRAVRPRWAALTGVCPQPPAGARG